MCLLLTLLAPTLAVVAGLPGPVAGTPPKAVEKQRRPDSAESLRDICHGKDLCWLVVMTPPQHGAFLVQAKFPDASRFILPGDAYCDRREYWHVAGVAHTLLAADCAEQWGPDSQAPVQVSLERDKIKLTYLERGYDRECETATALLDLATAKLLSLKRWKGVATEDQGECRRLKPLKPPTLGNGSTVPLVLFHSDSLSEDKREGFGSGGRSGM